MYYVKRTEPRLWTVGLDTPDGWKPFEDFGNPEEAQAFADTRNGITPPVLLESSNDTIPVLNRIAEALERIAEAMERQLT